MSTRLLLVDDDKTLLKFMHDFFEREGYEVWFSSKFYGKVT
ncbi:MAG: hypothetical protein P1P76_12325 [Anaerolineales bacterium]|nr:hypothetical protein [Anaerolineales bacterium]